jgi:hypothetical protein
MSDYDSSNASESSGDEADAVSFPEPSTMGFRGAPGANAGGSAATMPSGQHEELFQKVPSGGAAALFASVAPGASAAAMPTDALLAPSTSVANQTSSASGRNASALAKQQQQQPQRPPSVLAPAPFPAYPFRMLVLLHKWTAYQPVVLSAGSNGVMLSDWSTTGLTPIEQWRFDAIVGITLDPHKPHNFSIEIARSGFALRNAVWTFTTSRRPMILEQLLSFWDMATKGDSSGQAQFQAQIVDTARRKCDVTIVVRLGGVHI